MILTKKHTNCELINCGTNHQNLENQTNQTLGATSTARRKISDFAETRQVCFTLFCFAFIIYYYFELGVFLFSPQTKLIFWVRVRLDQEWIAGWLGVQRNTYAERGEIERVNFPQQIWNLSAFFEVGFYYLTRTCIFVSFQVWEGLSLDNVE